MHHVHQAWNDEFPVKCFHSSWSDFLSNLTASCNLFFGENFPLYSGHNDVLQNCFTSNLYMSSMINLSQFFFYVARLRTICVLYIPQWTVNTLHNHPSGSIYQHIPTMHQVKSSPLKSCSRNIAQNP